MGGPQATATGGASGLTAEENGTQWRPPSHVDWSGANKSLV